MKESKEKAAGMLQVRATLPPGTEGATAYVLDGKGALLTRARLDGSGEARVALGSADRKRTLRVFVGPADIGDDALLELKARGAVSRKLSIGGNEAKAVATFDISESILACWLQSRCEVPGEIVQRLGGIERPVCGATVEVYEVDPRWIFRLPDLELERIRDLLRHPLEELARPPFPPFPPEPEPWVHLRALSADAEFPRLQAAAAAGIEPFRAVLAAEKARFFKYLCVSFPTTRTLLATVKTDDCGRFLARFYRGCGNADQPDLYFVVKQTIGGTPTTIYAPTPVSCYTRWNYVCGTPVRLVTTNPVAQTCSDCQDVVAPDGWALLVGIGATRTYQVNGLTTVAPGTAANQGTTTGGAAFGGTLLPHLQFDYGLPAAGITHYRMSWRKVGSSDWTELSTPVYRHYEPAGGDGTVFLAEMLGPRALGPAGTRNNMYLIPPEFPPAGGHWRTLDAVADTTSGVFPSASFLPGVSAAAADNAGLVEIRVELFDSAGNPAPTSGVRWRTLKSEDALHTMLTEDANLRGLVDSGALVFRVRIDNNACSAAITGITAGASVVEPCCGLVKVNLDATVAISGTASQRNGFGSWSLSVARGPYAVGVSPSAGAATGVFVSSANAGTLLSQNKPAGCEPGPCPVAGFSAVLYVAAQVTDGWARQSGLDASAHYGFVLHSTSS